MSGLNLFPIFLIGLLGGLHCIGMCGGIVSAFSAAQAPRPFPVAVVAADTLPSGSQHIAVENALRVTAYNLGRIFSYTVAGALVGGLAEGIRTFAHLATLQIAGYWLANLMLVVLGLYLMDAWRGLARLEALGQILWRYVQPLMKPLLPMDSVGKAFALGGLWGWLPCGMVYSVLLTAMFAGSAPSGALVMLAFGLGTLPAMLGLGLVGVRLRSLAQQRKVRLVCGVIVLAFGVLGLLRVAGGLSADISGGLLDVLCITPQAAEVHR